MFVPTLVSCSFLILWIIPLLFPACLHLRGIRRGSSPLSGPFTHNSTLPPHYSLRPFIRMESNPSGLTSQALLNKIDQLRELDVKSIELPQVQAHWITED